MMPNRRDRFDSVNWGRFCVHFWIKRFGGCWNKLFFCKLGIRPNEYAKEYKKEKQNGHLTCDARAGIKNLSLRFLESKTVSVIFWHKKNIKRHGLAYKIFKESCYNIIRKYVGIWKRYSYFWWAVCWWWLSAWTAARVATITWRIRKKTLNWFWVT